MRKIRNRRGSFVAELPPALLILLCIILLPMFDFICLGLNYTVAMYYHHMVMEILAISPQNGPNSGINRVQNSLRPQFVQNGFAHFCGLNSANMNQRINDQVSYSAPTVVGGRVEPGMVACTTTVQLVPIFPLPLIDAFPAKFTSATVRENTN